MTVQKFISPEQAMKKAEAYCAYQERSQQEVRDKIYSWGLHKKEVEEILSTLITSGFLKEERFASAYAGGKFRIKKWGKNKIREGLRAKNVSEPLIEKALSSIDVREYKIILRKLIQSRSEKITELNSFKKSNKIASYLISRGFEPQLVWDELRDNFE